MKLTPAMQQFMKIKNEHPDCLLLFRMGDFYETFFEDAKVVSKALNIVLTARGNDKVPLAGIPFHSIDPYLTKLVKKGHKVAIVEQLEDPKYAKGLVKRGLVRIVTPGTILDADALDEKSNNFLVSVAKDGEIGIASVDLTTGEFNVTTVQDEVAFITELKKLNPSEVIIQPLHRDQGYALSAAKEGYTVHPYNDVYFFYDNCLDNLKRHFNVLSLAGFGIDGNRPAVCAAGSILSYLMETQGTGLANISGIRFYKTRDYLFMDEITLRNLELFSSIYQRADASLYHAVNRTKTPMGARLLRSWILRPLLDIGLINRRLDAVEEFTSDPGLIDEIQEILDRCLDIQRLMSRITNCVDCPKDMLALKDSLILVPRLRDLLAKMQSHLLSGLLKDDTAPVCRLIESSIREDAASHTREGNVIKGGYSEELDRLRAISKDAKQFILELEEKEKLSTGIKSLKIRFNRVFGYYIEVTKPNLNLVPDHYVRKQTQVNSERFITQELKEKEEMIINSHEKQLELEKEIYLEITRKVCGYGANILGSAGDIAVLDAILGFAQVAVTQGYTRPELTEGYDIDVSQARHPVLEHFVDEFIPNDISLNQSRRMMIITGPNMSGKSSYMRQVAMLSILAQAGSFVPAKSSVIPVVDRIFTRIGAFDDISSGQSTFMVEMNETANIVNNATEKSLIILDEIGRGTSTYDGISLAWAIAEYILRNIKAKTLFATHYHQLNRLAERFVNVQNFNVAVIENKEGIVFLHRIEEGGTDKSYGVEVARLAGLPKQLIDNARSIMRRLELEDVVASKLNDERIEKAARQMRLDEL